MENESKEFSFLMHERSVKYFARLDFALKQGRHIQNVDPDRLLYSYCDDYYKHLQYYYEHLYDVLLEVGVSDMGKYYYLDFKEEGRGKFAGDQRVEPLDEISVIIGILLLNLHNESVIRKDNIYSIEEVMDYIFNKEIKDNLLRLLTKADETTYYGKDNVDLKAKLRYSLNKFDRLGWVKWIDRSEHMTFEILPSLERLYLMYKYEIEHIDDFLKEI
ncbi:MAG TPA: chromosome partition protein MukE [Cytophagaceae bacterium]